MTAIFGKILLSIPNSNLPFPTRKDVLDVALSLQDSMATSRDTRTPIPIHPNLKTRPPSLFCTPSWATGLCEDLIKQNKGESRYSTRSMVLIKNPKSNDRSAIATPTKSQDLKIFRNLRSCLKHRNVLNCAPDGTMRRTP
ncbi:hypothetical protein J6590_024019, partial [Homalodisca vitripennis]